MTENENGINSQQDNEPTLEEGNNLSIRTPLNDALERIVNSEIIFFSGSSLANYVNSERQRLSNLRKLRGEIEDEQE